MKNKIDEIKASEIKKGETYTLSGDIGKFSKGDKVMVYDIKFYGDEVRVDLVRGDKVRDFFILDKNDSLDLD
jgi:hypothetical protein